MHMRTSEIIHPLQKKLLDKSAERTVLKNRQAELERKGTTLPENPETGNEIRALIALQKAKDANVAELAAVDAAIKSVSKVILKDHLQHCLVEAVHENDNAAILKLSQSIEQFIK